MDAAWLGAALAWVAAFGMFGRFVAVAKRREPGEGLALGAIFGPFGVLIEALLPAGTFTPGPASQATGGGGGGRATRVRRPDDGLSPDLLAKVENAIRVELDHRSPGWQDEGMEEQRHLFDAAKGRAWKAVRAARICGRGNFEVHAMVARRSLIGR